MSKQVTNEEIAGIRTEYRSRQMSDKDVFPDPVKQFELWFAEALSAQVAEPNAMTLSTATPDGRPSARIVLLKGINDSGFVFFTNYDSNKGKVLELNPWAALTFFWHELERQVRVEGRIVKISPEESDNYFNSRPRESQLGALASPQSSVIESREVLDRKFRDLDEIYRGREIHRPENWGGYCLEPELVEFWQGRPGRLHDRLQFTKNYSGEWKMDRLAP